MAEKSNENLTYIPETNGNPAILGKLKGICADFINPTRNGRKYSEKLWRKVFNDDITKEYFANGGIFGELGHPEDRAETDMEKIAICMPQPPVENNKGQLEATFDILNTPNGRILKTLVDYGYKIGISSRGTGDVYSDINGDEVVDEDTYDFQAFDVVILPAVKSARLAPVTEDLKKSKSLKQALNEQYNKANDDEKKVMKETFKMLELDEEDLTEGLESVQLETEDKIININVEDKSNLPVEGDYIDEIGSVEEEETDETKEAEDFGMEEVVENLQEALKKNRLLETQIEKLQKSLSVSNAKEKHLNEELDKYKEALSKVSKKANQVKDLTEELSQSQKQLQKQKEKNQSIVEALKESDSRVSLLEKTIAKKDVEIQKLNSKVSSLNESLLDLNSQNDSLKEKYSTKLQKAKDLVEHYKSLSTNAVNKYIEVKSNASGVSKAEIESRLGNSYNFKDIDTICESLQNYKLNVGKLPFTANKNVKMVVKESNDSLLKASSNFNDDEIDDSLLKLARLN